MAYIFISHSKRDIKLVKHIQMMIENLGHKPIIKEIPGTLAIQKPIPYDEIRSNIQLSDAVLAFITSEVVRTEYTKTWVNFEITTASAYSKLLFVFEHIDDIERLANLPYPIPYITDYMIFDKESSDDLLKVQKHVKEIMPVGPPSALVGGGLGALLGAPFGPLGIFLGAIGGAAIGASTNQQITNVERSFVHIKCNRCNTPYKYYSPNIKNFYCPVCRNPLQLQLEWR